MLASRTGQVLVRNPLPEKPATSAAYEPPSQKIGQVLVRTPGGETARISAPGTGYVRRSEIMSGDAVLQAEAETPATTKVAGSVWQTLPEMLNFLSRTTAQTPRAPNTDTERFRSRAPSA
jgi:hypothetical protein